MSGHLLAVSLADKSITTLGSGEPLGNLDGIEALDGTTFLVTDFVAGGLMTITTEGKATPLIELPSGSADIGFVPETGLLLVPLLKDNKLLAYQLD